MVNGKIKFVAQVEVREGRREVIHRVIILVSSREVGERGREVVNKLIEMIFET